jgi:ornithine cyclodeaminase/alanine dehydrogenase-like protein (mu-crystallin family)
LVIATEAGTKAVLNLDTQTVARTLPYEQLVDALEVAFAQEFEVPSRAHINVDVPRGTPGNLLLMPAWQPGGGMGVKIATVFPDNAKLARPAVFASYILMDANTGIPVAVLDGSELTLRRTAAASALASRFLSRVESETLLMVGTGNLAPHLIAAHAAVRPVKEVFVWGRRADAATALCQEIASDQFTVSVVDDLRRVAGSVDIISCATLSTEPLIRGEWLSQGQHIDLVGAFRPDMREVDTAALHASSIYVDTRAGACAEAGEIVQALQDKSITETDIVGELRDLATGNVAGRRDNEITLFKSVGTALEDLAAAELAIRNLETGV